MKLMNVAQLELSLSNGRTQGRPAFRRPRQTRARWWFQRMRQAVNQARDWQPAPTARPEQIWFPNAHRQIETPAPANEQHEICE